MAKFRGVLGALILVAIVFAASHPARASLSGEMQGAIADMVNNAITNEDAKGLGAAINDLCAAHPDIKEEIVAAVASELAARRPPGFCAGKAGPCLDLDSIMETLLVNILIPYNTTSGETQVVRRNKRNTVAVRDNTAECGGGDCSPDEPQAVEPPPSSSPSPVEW